MYIRHFTTYYAPIARVTGKYYAGRSYLFSESYFKYTFLLESRRPFPHKLRTGQRSRPLPALRKQKSWQHLYAVVSVLQRFNAVGFATFLPRRPRVFCLFDQSIRTYLAHRSGHFLGKMNAKKSTMAETERHT